MKIHNGLPILIDCLKRWETRPTRIQFETEYARPVAAFTGDFFEDFYEVIEALDWKAYRMVAIRIDPVREERRLLDNIARVEALFGFKLPGEVCLVGTFHSYDGFARFDRGEHRVFLGVDENHDNGKYIDILAVHELTHVARETRPEVWEAFGLDPKMPRSVYLNAQTVVEHLFGEGFSCLVSELLVPGQPAWAYAYQTADTWKVVQDLSHSIDHEVKKQLRDPDSDYGSLYGIRPRYAHYVWAWKWARHVLDQHGGDARKLVGLGSKNLVSDALNFKFVP